MPPDPVQTVVLDDSAAARHYFPATTDDTARYDVIIVGSGAGGGSLAYELSGRPWRGGPAPRVLVLEAGGFLLGTHTGNLPRHQSAATDTYHPSLFQAWRTFGRRSWHAADAHSEQAQLAQGINLGGRTVFWGACAPRMRRWEFRDWPAPVADDLLGRWYERAEQLMRVAPLRPSPYQSAVKAGLRAIPALAGFRHDDAPMAIEYTAPVSGAVPAGFWSTAELLLHRAVQDHRTPNPHVNLHHEVVQIEATGPRATAVVAYDHSTGRERTFRLADDGAVVLAAGTIGSPGIAGLSGLNDPQRLVGKGITDHPFFVVKFWVPRDTDWYTRFDSSKTLSQHVEPGDAVTPEHPYNMMLELGANLNQYRFTSSSQFTDGNLATAGGRMPGEAVFLIESPLVDANAVTHSGERQPGTRPAALPTIRMHRSPAADGLHDTLDKISAEVVARFDGEISEQLWGPPGGVSHEAGTMRMARTNQGQERAGVVDEHLRMQGYDNLHVCDLSVFPSSPAANPTLTLVALALRLAARLAAA